MKKKKRNAGAFAQFLEAYPPAKRKGGDDVLLNALAQHKRSVQWQNPRYIPWMTTWLAQERWVQVLPEQETPVISKADQERILNRLTPIERAQRFGRK